MKLTLVTFFTEAASTVLALILRYRKRKGKVLHVSYGVHIASYTVEILRSHGIEADYLAVGRTNDWSRKADLAYEASGSPAAKRWKEFLFFWRHIASYPVMHCHFMITLSDDAWEMKFYKRLGGRVVAHFRGCEIRNKDLNMKLHPAMNICQVCDYQERICKGDQSVSRRRAAELYADYRMVTTPDMKDFLPEAEHMPFFTPPLNVMPAVPNPETFKVVHVTNHPGIEGTSFIADAIDELKAEGLNITFVNLKGVQNEVVFRELSDAHLSVGKMKMGYYANAQIESLYAGVPAVTYIRPEFITDELRESALILTDLNHLKNTLHYYYHHPRELENKRIEARRTAQRLHDNHAIANRYREIYVSLTGQHFGTHL